jgi:hypothetical protein
VDPASIWGNALEILKAAAPDVRLVNLETAVTRGGTPWAGKDIHYRMHPQNIACLTAAGLDCAVLANNHVLDWGLAGLDETLETLHHAGIHTAGAGESQIDDLIGDLEQLSNPTVGLSAHSGQVDVRITAKADTEELADKLIHPLEETLRQRLGDWVYGADEDTLEKIVLDNLAAKDWTLTVVEAGLNGDLIRRLAAVPGPFSGGEILTQALSVEELAVCADAYRRAHAADRCPCRSGRRLHCRAVPSGRTSRRPALSAGR